MRTVLASLAGMAVALVAAASAHAAYTGAVTGAGDATLTGDTASDDLVVTTNGFGQLEHSAIGPGFASAADWDSSVGGIQAVLSDPAVIVTVNGGEGEDNLIIGSETSRAFDVKTHFEWNGGGSPDLVRIDDTADTQAQTFLTAATGATIDGGPRVDTGVGFTEGIVLRGGSQGDTFNVLGTPQITFTLLEGNGGGDSFVFPSGFSSVGGDVFARGNDGVDAVSVDESAATTPFVYAISSFALSRGVLGSVGYDETLESLSLRTGSGADSITKTGDRPATIDAGPGTDQVVTRDAVADNVTCGTESDFVLSDPLDALAADCEASDRTLGQAPPPAPPAAVDRTTPKLTLSGLPKKTITVKQLLKGLRVRVASDEPVALDVAALGSSTRVSLSRTYNVQLATARAPLAAGARTLTLKPSKRLVGRARKFSVRVSVTGTDASGNRVTTAVIVKVKR